MSADLRDGALCFGGPLDGQLVRADRHPGVALEVLRTRAVSAAELVALRPATPDALARIRYGPYVVRAGPYRFEAWVVADPPEQYEHQVCRLLDAMTAIITLARLCGGAWRGC